MRSRVHHFALLLAAAMGLTANAFALGPEECVKLHASGQDAKEAGKLVEARRSFVQCAADACPQMVREECVRLLGNIESSLPTFVFQAKESGQPTRAVSVKVDGKPLLDELKATAVPVDPGDHTFEFTASDGKTLEKHLTALEGQKNRLVEVEFAAPEPVTAPRSEQKPAAPKPTTHPVPAGAYVLGAVGIVALGGFGYFALTGKSKQSDLEKSCAPRCSPDEYDKMKRDYLFADISLGVAVVAGGLATWLVVGRSESGPAVGLTPVRSGAVASYGASF